MYADGTTEMYGSTKRNDFIGIEGPADPGVDMLFCWDTNKKLTGIIMNVSCPSQVVEAKYFISSDYWSEVRKQVKQKFGDDIFCVNAMWCCRRYFPSRPATGIPRGANPTCGKSRVWSK